MLSSISRLSSLTGSSSRALNLSLRPLSLIKLTSPKKEEEHPSKKFNFHTISSTLTSTSLSTPNITSLSAVRYFSLKKEDENLKIKEDNNIKINENSDNNMVEKKKSIKEKFVSLWKKYGMVFVTTYFTIYFSTIGGMFFALEYNIIPLASFGINPENLIEKFISVFSHFLPGENISSWLKNYPECKY